MQAADAGSSARLDRPWNRTHGGKRRGSLKDVCYSGKFNDPKSKECLQGEQLLFLHIPKTAGSAIVAAAMKAGVGWGKRMNFAGCDLGSDDCTSDWHIPPALMNDINVYSDASVFCVVRNPLARAVSEYKYVMANWKAHPGFFPHKEITRQYGCSVHGLNEWLAVSLRDFVGGKFGIRDCHMVPQASYIWGPPDARGQQCQYCHEILRLEEFPHSFDSLMERYGYRIRLGPKHVNKGVCPDLSVKDLNATTLRLLQSVYRADFKMLNYSADVSQVA